MNSLLDYRQTTDVDWAPVRSGLLYNGIQEGGARPTLQLRSDSFAECEQQIVRFEADYWKVVREIRRKYVFVNDDEVEEFLRFHRTVPELLIEALPFLRAHIGDVLFTLRSTSDEYGWQLLYVVTVWPGQAQDVITAIDRFEDAWWIANSHRAFGSLNFTYQLV